MIRAIMLAALAATGCSSQRHAPDEPADGPGGKAERAGEDVDAGTDAGVDAAAGAIWQPPPETTWQWQLSGTIDTSFDVAMYDVDLFDAPDAKLATLRAAGRIVICYFSAGSREDWRPDATDFPAAAIGSPLDNWPGEAWIDTRPVAVHATMRPRPNPAKRRG